MSGRDVCVLSNVMDGTSLVLLKTWNSSRQGLWLCWIAVSRFLDIAVGLFVCILWVLWVTQTKFQLFYYIWEKAGILQLIPPEPTHTKIDSKMDKGSCPWFPAYNQHLHLLYILFKRWKHQTEESRQECAATNTSLYWMYGNSYSSWNISNKWITRALAHACTNTRW